MIDLFNYSRRKASVVNVGNTPLGGDNPVRVQSMTTTQTTDTEGSVAQTERIVDAGGEYVRLTTQGVREAENLKNIGERLRADGYAVPIVADVHFNPNVADVAALYAGKVRVNPGNYVDPARTFRQLEYTDEEYAAELQKIEQRFVPFLNICREHHTAVRIGVNHGSLSDRIMSRYGDTPEGIVESCMEFLRICKREKFDDVVISIKASNTVVMVRSVRLLVDAMERADMYYPLHLGVTEAGEGEDGRIKSAVGIGALLADGIGDTIRVSLSEEPEAEIPVARHLVDYVTCRDGHMMIPATACAGFDWLHPERRKTTAVGNIGGDNVPVVVGPAPLGPPKGGCPAGDTESDEQPNTKSDMKPDYIYIGGNMPANPASGHKYIVDFNVYQEHFGAAASSPLGGTEGGAGSFYPIFPHTAMPFIGTVQADVKFLVLQYGVPAEEYTACLRRHPEVVVVCVSNHQNRLGEQRALIHEISAAGLTNPVVICQMYRHTQEEKGDFQLEAAVDMGALMFDGVCDGIWLMNDGTLSSSDICDTAFGILQAARLRTSKTEYISCPGCGRTLYDLRSTIARIKEATAHLKGLKIGIMGCIVNGPGEMADADYGYVGAGRGKISLYRRKECVAKNIPEEEAVERLLELIDNDTAI
ncbi:4-hydroxy-3-methylbut-2-en-1-yl diphosphate synthase [Xylanibacter rodentium]|jgi:(E)-4-hydroxy-3-methylbut-2-enyl-diphosphate synthase|uniref:4-hydroxy-3-methylbut-2-en-1-yl diphosphate synthase (flavodoxin) n=1 Tax=Xylanibacter rodentium TaxID=2736289 RepID=A0ABX2AW96_9BACT|nr:4-hydroxy-3-methylbut-2-en-1-yl diphosphate synthase [Xylanibacter rodentium]NPE10550.1 4-hydroxy-3-methylbut-2-en-1-yl diphosphate synthase [Prevotella sp. PJ1A]NPE15059.1 4-hydroxy-3-methylbut-2-en-1-yl diphosphate synthase [Xylanibacter rodentium]NPE38223.1 4-hydroxy-3-methylbut-2-en-1-yl diphosphate synthase [Prevotella sp. PCJ2]